MGKAFIYVFLVIVLVVVVIAVGWGLTRLAQRGITAAQERHRCALDAATPWSSYLIVGPTGEYLIGVHRCAIDDDAHLVFEGPHQMYTLPADHDPLDVEVKVGEAEDRAGAYNLKRERTR